MSTFPSTNYEPLLTTEDDEEEELSELPPTFVTTRGPEKNGNGMTFIFPFYSLVLYFCTNKTKNFNF